MPVLAIHGGGDLGSPISAAQDYLTSLVEPSKTFIGVSEAGHLVEFATPDQFAMHVLNLLEYMCNGEYAPRSEEHTSELQSRFDLVCRLLLENQPAASELYPLSLHDALPIWGRPRQSNFSSARLPHISRRTQ